MTPGFKAYVPRPTSCNGVEVDILGSEGCPHIESDTRVPEGARKGYAIPLLQSLAGTLVEIAY